MFVKNLPYTFLLELFLCTNLPEYNRIVLCAIYKGLIDGERWLTNFPVFKQGGSFYCPSFHKTKIKFIKFSSTHVWCLVNPCFSWVHFINTHSYVKSNYSVKCIKVMHLLKYPTKTNNGINWFHVSMVKNIKSFYNRVHNIQLLKAKKHIEALCVVLFSYTRNILLDCNYRWHF